MRGLVRIFFQTLGLGRWATEKRNTRRIRNFDYLTDWHQAHKILFVHVPKAAGNSFKASIGDITDRRYPHIPAATVQKKYPVFFQGAHKVCIMRDPVDRFISAWAHIQKKNYGFHDPILDTANPEDLKDWIRFQSKFCSDLYFRNLVLSAMHFKPQWYFLCDASRNLLVDKIYTLDELDQARAEVSEYLSIRSQPLDQLNSSLRDNVVASEQLIKTIKSIYQFDFDLIERR